VRRTARSLFALVLIAGAAVGVVSASSAAALPAYRCGTLSGGSTTVHSQITDVRVGRHASFDRFVIVFSTHRVPHYRIVPKSNTTFALDPSGRSVTLLGTAGQRVVLHTATGVGTYHGSADFRTGFPQLVEARRLGDFEGYVTWGLGLAHQSCKRVFTLTNPTRLVIDVPH
jgi:hypothetical protein